MPIFLCVTKDLSNRLIDMVLHRGEASHHSKLKCGGAGTTTLLQEKLTMMTLQRKIFPFFISTFCFSL